MDSCISCTYCKPVMKPQHNKKFNGTAIFGYFCIIPAVFMLDAKGCCGLFMSKHNDKIASKKD